MDEIKLIIWNIVVDNKQYQITEDQLEAFVKADLAGMRFFRLEKALINIAFVKEVFRRVEYRNANDYLSSEDKMFLEKPSNQLQISE